MVLTDPKKECAHSYDIDLYRLWIWQVSDLDIGHRPLNLETFYSSEYSARRKGISDNEIKRLVEDEVKRQLEEYAPLLEKLKAQDEEYKQNWSDAQSILRKLKSKSRKKKKKSLQSNPFKNYKFHKELAEEFE